MNTQDQEAEVKNAGTEIPESPAPASDDLAARLAAAEQAASEAQDAFLRAKAEAENIRRRAQEDIAKAGKFAVEKFAQALLPVRDSLQMALADTTSAVETLRSGVEITLKQLDSAFQGAQLIEVNPLGEKFDPHRHQAISTQEHEGEANLVLNVFQKGYLLNERVIRPALVVVSKAKETS